MIEKLKDKYVFFDVDGTLSEYRYNDHVSGGNARGGQTYEELFFGDVFIKNRPLKVMQRIVEQLNPDKMFVLGAITTSHELLEKFKWLPKHYPNIKQEHYVFVGASDMKVIALEKYSEKLNIKKSDIVLIDDKHATIRAVEEAGFIAYHPTSFIE